MGIIAFLTYMNSFVILYLKLSLQYWNFVAAHKAWKMFYNA